MIERKIPGHIKAISLAVNQFIQVRILSWEQSILIRVSVFSVHCLRGSSPLVAHDTVMMLLINYYDVWKLLYVMMLRRS